MRRGLPVLVLSNVFSQFDASLCVASLLVFLVFLGGVFGSQFRFPSKLVLFSTSLLGNLSSSRSFGGSSLFWIIILVVSANWVGLIPFGFCLSRQV